MLRLSALAMRPLRLLQSYPWPLPTVVAPHIDNDQVIDEEKAPYYDPKDFYPTRLGEILNDRYQVATKVGFGANSTVWLARDLFQWRWLPSRFVTIKINAADHDTRRTAENELHITKHISKANPRHLGWHFVRTMLDSFTVKGPSSDHICLVFEPLREPLWLLKQRYQGEVIPSWILKLMVEMLLHGLDYLHDVCHVIHADLKLDNVMVRLEDKSLLEKSALDELNDPLPQKKCDDRTIYLTRNNYGQQSTVTAFVSIIDFGFSVRGDGPHSGYIRVESYRAPEVILDAGWTYSSDIWSLGVMLWDLLETKPLFEALYPLKTGYDDQSHLAYITALLGPPPKDLLALGERTSLFYDSELNVKRAVKVPSDFSLENSIIEISGEDKRMFLEFVSRMLKWQPKDRSTAKDLLNDPWLKAKFPEEDT